MDTYTLMKPVTLIGFHVNNFPQGVQAAFSKLMEQFDKQGQHSYYGLSHMDEKGKIYYYAATEQSQTGEEKEYGYEKYTIPKGEYLSETLVDWLSKTDCIKDIFHEMMQDPRADLTKQCIEWYKNDKEMICLMAIDPTKQVFTAVDQAANELLQLLQPLTQEQINTIPFKDSWTAAQLATHVTKSNNAIFQAMDMEGKVPGRKPTERIDELKKIFLDFNHELQSPEFILPKPGVYNRENVIAAIIKSNHDLQKKRVQVNLSEVIDSPIFGQITRLELFYFVLFHTQRHIRQLKKILTHV